MRNRLLALVALLVATSSPGQDFRTIAEKTIAEPPFDKAIWAIRVEESDGTPVYARNDHTLMIPASNRKLFAASTVVNCLGWNARLQTDLWLDGEDLVLRGGGDPSLGGRYYDTAAFAFDPLVRAVRGRGLRTVRDVVADVSLFDRVTVPGSWKVGNLPYSYAAPVDPLTYAENVNGAAAVVEPGLFAAQALRDALSFAGITVTGSVRLCTAACNSSGHAEQLAAIRSPFVYQLLSTVLENSQNLYTEVLFKDLSLPQSGVLMAPPSPASPVANAPAVLSPVTASYAQSLEIERRFLVNEVGIDPAEFRFVDGSGLSSDDLVTPSAIIRLLRWINAPERRGAFWSVMATPGELGTLHHRLVDLGPRLRAKTGTINGVNSLSGFVAGKNGDYRYFSIIVNHHTGDSDEAERIIDTLVAKIAEF